MGESIEDGEQELKSTAERFAVSMGQQFDVEFDFSVESLTRLDGWLAQWIDLTDVYSSDRPEDVLPVALAVTAYVGEVILRNIGGASWVTATEENQLPPPHIRFENGVRVNLMKKSIEVLTGADSPSFSRYFTTVVELGAGDATGTAD